MIFSLLAKGTLIDFLSSWQIIVAIVLLAFGIAIALTAKWCEKRNYNSGSIFKWRVVAVVTILVGLAFFIVGAALLGGIF